MLKRIITAIVMLCVFIPIVIFSDTAVFPIAVALCACVATFEMLKCMGLHKKLIISIPLCEAAIAFPLLMRYMNDLTHVAAIAFIAAIVYLVAVFAAIVWSHGQLTFTDAMSAVGVVTYIIAAFCGILYVRDIPGGAYIFLLIFMKILFKLVALRILMIYFSSQNSTFICTIFI